jgi:signal transduction histidine kinase/ActR/RegA family two-component response regulator
MKHVASRVGPVVTGLLVMLTYLLLRAATPDSAAHQRRLTALDAVILNQAALHRDVLKARAGSLRNYDPLVSAIAGLRGAVHELKDASRIGAEVRPEICQHVDALAAEVDAEEALIEEFKSTNALLQNSLTYSAHLTQRLGTLTRDESPRTAAAVGIVAESMLRFTRDPAGDASAALGTSLNRLADAPVPGGARQDARALVDHGRLILTALPGVDRSVARLFDTRTIKEAQSIQQLLLGDYRHAERQAHVYRMLLYVASVLLLAHLSYLYVRLQANVRALAERSDFEHLIASISAHFIALPPDRIGAGVRAALRRLGRHVAADRAYVVIADVDRADVDGSATDRTYGWWRPAVAARLGSLTPDWPGGALRLGADWAPAGHERQGYLEASPVAALPQGPERTTLEAHHVRSWLCVPLRHAGERIGILGFDRVDEEKRWPEDDLPLLRTAGEIFANAFARERAEREREALQARLQQAHRMEAIGELAGGVAHNFNNLLGAILGNTEMALAAVSPRSAAHRHLHEVRKAGERGKGVVDQILTFSRQAEHTHRPVRVQPEVEDAVGLLRASLPATITIRTHLDAADAVVRGDAAQLQQVVMNLCTNAAQAMQGHGIVDVTIEAIDLPNEQLLSHGTLAPGPYVRLAVTDSGDGMDAATVGRIFEPFFTTKAATTGTGLGLSTVHGIVVADHGGALSVRSRRGAGSRFEAWLPRVDAADAHRDAAEVPDVPVARAVPRGRGETILLVDDEPSLVLLGEEMLAALGYEPVGFEKSAEALAAFRAAPHRFDLLLADEAMPEISGTQLAAAVHEIRREIPILLMSGLGTPADPRRRRAAGVRDVLKKPLVSADIATALSRHLRQVQSASTTTSND